uniref:Protein preY, mitochondrial n=1 Tax=Xenopus tropicalis TaxID=8364 RepID=Q07G37_XENTR|nr:novel Trm112p-like protein protein [Xenopus tropicalis]
MLAVRAWGRTYNTLVQRKLNAACPTGALPAVTLRPLHCSLVARSPEQSLKDSKTFDPTLLQFLVCPLSRKSLRYEESTNELINDELGIAYPIVDGIPNMIPQDARMIHKDQKPESPDTEQTT